MKRCLLMLALAASLLCAEAGAGTPCETKPSDVTRFRKAMTPAERTLVALDNFGAQLALIARVG